MQNRPKTGQIRSTLSVIESIVYICKLFIHDGLESARIARFLKEKIWFRGVHPIADRPVIPSQRHRVNTQCPNRRSNLALKRTENSSAEKIPKSVPQGLKPH